MTLPPARHVRKKPAGGSVSDRDSCHLTNWLRSIGLEQSSLAIQLPAVFMPTYADTDAHAQPYAPACDVSLYLLENPRGQWAMTFC